jgi:hypothetical protein
MISGDGHQHQVLVRTPTAHRLTVPAGGRASVLLRPLKAGRYPIDIDGTERARLFVGAAPGP